eukprot:3639315-Prymnesium_polylepis.1
MDDAAPTRQVVHGKAASHCLEAGACPASNGKSTAGHSSEHRRASTGPGPGSRQHQALRSTRLRVSHTVSVDHRDACGRGPTDRRVRAVAAGQKHTRCRLVVRHVLVDDHGRHEVDQAEEQLWRAPVCAPSAPRHAKQGQANGQQENKRHGARAATA